MAFRPGFWPPIMASRAGYHEDLDDDDEDLIESSPSPLSQARRVQSMKAAEYFSMQHLRTGKQKTTNELCNTPISNASRHLTAGPRGGPYKLLPCPKLPRPSLAVTRKAAAVTSGGQEFTRISMDQKKRKWEESPTTMAEAQVAARCVEAIDRENDCMWNRTGIRSGGAVCQLASTGALQTNFNHEVSQREIFVDNVPLDLSADRLLALFAGYGEIEEIPLGFDNFTGRSWGFALIIFKTVDAAKRALQEPIKTIDGIQMCCKLAAENQKQQQQQQGRQGPGGISDNDLILGRQSVSTYIPRIEIDDSAPRGTKFNDRHVREGCLNTLSTETSTREAWRPSNDYRISKSSPEKAFGRAFRNKTEISESRGATDDHDAICKGEIWDEEFAAFANRKPTQSSTTLTTIPAALDALQAVASKGQILHVERIPARPPAYTNYHFKLEEKLMKALHERGVKRFYTHQVKAMELVFKGSSIVAATPTASGKSLTYIVPVLSSLIRNSNLRALFIFPSKALARDQLKVLSGLVAEVKKGSHCYCYDGDTDTDKRSLIRGTAKIVLTTPDMLHVGILPNHKLWKNFFSDLRFVVVDEVHSYRGIFGSHVGCVLRRLLRISRYYDSEPMFICCSATMTNPKDHVKKLTTIDMEVIYGSGAPAGEKHVMCWLPPETKNGSQRSHYKDSAKIVVALMIEDLQILVFVEDRKSSEIVCKMVRQKLAKKKRFDLVSKVDSYRAGYTQVERISLEKRLQDGQLRALVTTNALELGIDVGNLDATVHVGLPDSMCSLWQQAGRAGRRQGASLAVIVGRGRELDVFYMKNPQKLFSRDVEQVVCNPTNPYILRLHLRCAANEIPLSEDDVQYFGENYKKVRDELLFEGILQHRTGPTVNSLYGYRYDDSPASEIAIRGIFGNNFQLLTGNNEMVEEVDEKMAPRVLYEGAIYRHASDTYRIKYLDFEKRKAFGELYELHHMTEANVKTKVKILEKIASRTALGTRIHLGKLEIIEQVTGYSEYDVTKRKQIDTVALNYPPSVLRTVGLWWDYPAEVMQKLKHMAYEALLVLKRVVLPLLAAMTMSSTTDIFALETSAHEQTEQPEVFFYDAYGGGIGLAEQAYKDVEHAWRRALNVLQTCDCRFGCPSCTRRACENVDSEANSSKHAAIVLLQCLLCTKLQVSVHATVNYTTAEPRISKDQMQNHPNYGVNPLGEAVDRYSNDVIFDHCSQGNSYASALRLPIQGQMLPRWLRSD